MKRTIVTIIFVMIISVLSFGQLTGTKNIPGDYTTVSNAIFALNGLGVGTGGVTFVIAGGYAETLPALNSGLITVTGTAANPIVFQRGVGGANPVISGCTAGPNAFDYVFGLQGADYITFDGIDVADATGSIEWGYAVLKGSATNGSQFITIKNCNITLKQSNANTVGIYSANILPGTLPAAQLTVTDVAGSNSNNKFFSNTISGCYSGIVVNGFADAVSPYTYYDQSNELGKDGGNTVTGPGGNSTACYGIFTSYQNRLTIANNLVNGTVNSNGAGTCAGIQLNTANNANVNVYSNTVTIAYNGVANFYGFYNNMGSTCTNNTYNFYNNIVTNCTYPNATSNSCYYMYNTNSAVTINHYNNQITNNTYGSSAVAATGAIYGMYTGGGPTTQSTTNNYGNTISGIVRKQSAAGGTGSTYYMYLVAGGTQAMINVHDNLVANDTNNTVGVGITYCLYLNNGSLVKNCYNNTIRNIHQANGQVIGVYMSEGNNQSVYNNKVQNMKTLGSVAASSIVYGLWLQGSSSGGPLYAYNNMISELKAPNSTSPNALYGIYGFGSGLATLGIFNNTVYLDGTSTGSGFGTVGLYLGSAPASIDVRNNIIVNNTTPTGTGLAIAMKSNKYSLFFPGVQNFSPAVNNNNYFAGTPSSTHLIAYITDGTNFVTDMTLNDYKTREWPKECYSVSENTPFVNVTTSPYDLHLSTSLPTQCESAGTVVSTPVSIVNDFDYDARYPNAGYPENPTYPAVAPDMGADELAGIPDDRLAPVIIYTPLANSTSTDDRILTATIADAHGVPTSGLGMPRLAWKKFYTGTWNYVDGVSIGSSQYTFTFGAGVSSGDSVYYYVLAQDQFTTPNVGTYPLIGSGGFSVSPPAASVPPTATSAYKVIAGRCGTLTVGVGKFYQTITQAFNDLAAEGVNCPVVLELTDNTYPTETWPMIINPIPGTSAVNTVTLRPAAGKTPLIETSIATVGPYYYSMISLNGCQYVIFDGSNSGGSDRSMTFSNYFSGVGGSAVIGLHNNGLAGAGNITIRNCIVKAFTDYVGNKQGIVCFTIVGNAGYHDLLFTNNEVKAGKFGIQIAGITSNPCNNAVVTNNIVGSSDPSQAITALEISVGYTNNVLIQDNEILGPPAGMSGFYLGQPIGINITSGVTLLTIKHNTIHDLYSLDAAVPSTGIFYSSNTPTVTEISNNLIYNIKSTGSSLAFNGPNAIGLYVNSGTNFKIQHNSIWMEGSYLNTTTAAVSACVYFRNSITLVDFRNNILKNSSQLLPGGTAASKSYCIAVGISPSAFTTLDYNDYFCDGVGAVLASYNSVDKPTLLDWQTITSMDAHAKNIDPVFTSATNLLPTSTAMPKAGIYIPALPIDYAGVARTNPPDMGAFEFSPIPAIATTAATDILVNSSTLNGTINPTSLDVNVYFDYGLTTAYGTSVNGNPFTVNGGLLLNINAAIASLTANTTYHFRIRAVTFGGITVYGNDMTFTTASGIPENITVTGTIGETVSNCYNASNMITVAGGGTTFEVQSGGSATFIAWQKISFLPGTIVQNGGYMHGYISPGTYCNPPAMPAVAAGEMTTPNTLQNANFSIYPNPASANFTLVQKGDKLYGNVKVEVFTMRGDKVMTETMIGEKSHDFSFSDMATGLYFVKVVADGYAETMKLVKL
ncbi:MAG: T9SS type A sorting domain-containing protein [Bacteroidetes bacterium]|nr:T9SS type A sorting domain-containing protein [Bacteroidota bacterium]